MLDYIKTNLHISDDCFDDELNGYIDFVKQELEDLGIVYLDETNAKFKRLCFLYSASQRDWRGKADWFLKQYEKLRDHLILQTEYKK